MKSVEWSRPSCPPRTAFGITNAFTLLRLLPDNDRDKDAEILALRHHLAVPHRQPDEQRVRLDSADRPGERFYNLHRPHQCDDPLPVHRSDSGPGPRRA